jgi:hypothetical protein
MGQRSISKVSAHLRGSWNAIQKACIETGCTIVSAPFATPIVLEAPMDATLPVTLRELGYPIRLMRTAEKLLPKITEERRGNKFYKNEAMVNTPIQVFEIAL